RGPWLGEGRQGRGGGPGPSGARRGGEMSRVRDILARHTHSPMGRERALSLEPRSDLPTIKSSLSETREGRQALAIAGSPPWESIPDVRELLERARVPGSVAEGAELAALVPFLDAGARLAAYGRSIAVAAPALSRALAGLPRRP